MENNDDGRMSMEAFSDETIPTMYMSESGSFVIEGKDTFVRITGSKEKTLPFDNKPGLGEFLQLIQSNRDNLLLEGYKTKYAGGGKEYLILYPTEEKELLRYFMSLLTSGKVKFIPYELELMLSGQVNSMNSSLESSMPDSDLAASETNKPYKPENSLLFSDSNSQGFGFSVIPSKTSPLVKNSSEVLDVITENLNLCELLSHINSEFLGVYALLASDAAKSGAIEKLKNSFLMRDGVEGSNLNIDSVNQDDRIFLSSLLQLLRNIINFVNSVIQSPILLELKRSSGHDKVSFNMELFELQVEQLNKITILFSEDISHFGLIKITKAFHSAIGSFVNGASYYGMVKSLQNVSKEINEAKTLPITHTIKRQVIILERLLDSDVNDKDLVARVSSAVLRDQINLLNVELKQLLFITLEVFEKKVVKQEIFEELANRIKFVEFRKRSLLETEDGDEDKFSMKMQMFYDLVCSAVALTRSFKPTTASSAISSVENYADYEKKFQVIVTEIERMIQSSTSVVDDDSPQMNIDNISDINQNFSLSMIKTLRDWLENIPKPRTSYDAVSVNTYEKLKSLINHEKNYSTIGSFRLNIPGSKNSIFIYNIDEVIDHECAKLWFHQQMLDWLFFYDSSSFKWLSFFDGSARRISNAAAEILQPVREKIVQLVKSYVCVTSKQLESLIDLHSQSLEPSVSMAAFVLFQRCMHLIIDSIANHGYLTSVGSLPSPDLQHVYVQLTETAFATLCMLTLSLPLFASAANILEECFISVIENSLEACYPSNLPNGVNSRIIPDFVSTGNIAIPEADDIKFSNVFKSLLEFEKIFSSAEKRFSKSYQDVFEFFLSSTLGIANTAEEQTSNVGISWLQKVDMKMPSSLLDLLEQVPSEIERRFLEQFYSSFIGMAKAFESDDYLSAKNIIDAWTTLSSSSHEVIYARYREIVDCSMAYHRVEKILAGFFVNFHVAFNLKDVLSQITQVNTFEVSPILRRDIHIIREVTSRDETIDQLLHDYRRYYYDCHVIVPSKEFINSTVSNVFHAEYFSNLDRLDSLISYVLGKGPRPKEYDPYAKNFMTSFHEILSICVEYVKKLSSIDSRLRNTLKSYHVPVFKLPPEFQSLAEFMKTAFVLTYPIESSIGPNAENMRLISEDILRDLEELPYSLNPAKDLLEECSLLPAAAFQSKGNLLRYLKEICDIHDNVHTLAKGFSVDHKDMTSSHLHSAIQPAFRSYLHAYSLMSNNYLVKHLESSIAKSSTELMAQTLSSASGTFSTPVSNYELKSYVSSIFNHLPYEKSPKLLEVYYSLELIFECRLAQQSKSYIYFDKVLLMRASQLNVLTSNVSNELMFFKDIADTQKLSNLFHILSDYMSEKFTLFSECNDKYKGALLKCSHCTELSTQNRNGNNVINSDDSAAMLLQLLNFLRQPCDTAALDYLANFMMKYNGFKLLQDLSELSSAYHRIIISYIYASIRTCYRQVMERYCYHQLIHRKKAYYPGPSPSGDVIFVKDRFPHESYRDYFHAATSLSWRNRACSSKLRRQKFGERINICHSSLFAVDVKPGSLRFSKYSSFHPFSRTFLWRWHDEELFREINENTDLSNCKGRIDLSIIFIQSYLNICNILDKFKALNVVQDVNEDLYRIALWTMTVRQLIFTESWNDLEEKLHYYKRNESAFYPGRSADYIGWMHQGPLKLHRIANAVMLHHHSIYTLDQLITAVNVHDKKSNGLFFKFIDFELLDEALKTAMKCSIQSDELRQKIAMCKFIYDLNISTSQGYWVDDHAVMIDVSSLSPPASPHVLTRTPSDPIKKKVGNNMSSHCIIPSVASLLRVCNDFMMTKLSESDDRNIPISVSVFPTLIQSEIQNIEREFNNQQIEDRLIESIDIGKDYLTDITNLASKIDIQSLERIVEAASTLRHRSQRNISLYHMAVKVMRLRQAVKSGNWNLIRGLINEMNLEQLVPEVVDEINQLKELSEHNQIMHQKIIEAMSANQVKGTQFQLDVEGVDVTNLLRALSFARNNIAPVLSAYDHLMVYSAEKLAILRSCVLMEDYDKLREEIDKMNFSNISSYCIQEILLIKSSIDLWMNFRQVHDCLRGGGVSGNVGQLNVRCPSLFPLSSALQAVSVVSYPDSTRVFVSNARFIERLRQAVKGGKWNIEAVSITLSQQLQTILDYEQTYKAKVSRISSSKISTPTIAISSSTVESHDSRFKLCRIENAEYCAELFGGQLLKPIRNLTTIPSFYDVSLSEALSKRRYNKDIEYVWKILLSNLSQRLDDASSFDVEYWSPVKPTYFDVASCSMFISKLLIPHDIAISNKTGKIMINPRNRIVPADEITTSDEAANMISKHDVSDLLLSINCLVADIENEVLLIRDELYHRISMFVLQEGLNRDKILIDDDRLLSAKAQTHQSTSASLFPKTKTLTKAAFQRTSTSSSTTTAAPYNHEPGASEPEEKYAINLSTAIMIVEHLGIKSPAVLRRYRTSLLVRKLRDIIAKKKISSVIQVLQEVKILKNSDCFDSLAINEVDNTFIYISNLNIRKQIYQAFHSYSNISLLDLKFQILRILREHNDNIQAATISSNRYGKDPMASTIKFSRENNATSTYAVATDVSAMPTIHSRHLFRLCEACAEFVDAIGRLASRRVQSSRRFLEQVWNELDHRYYEDEYEDGFKYVKSFVLDMFERYPDIPDDHTTLDSSTYSLRELIAAKLPDDTPKLIVVGRASDSGERFSDESSASKLPETLDFISLFDQVIVAVDVLVAESLGEFISIGSIDRLRSLLSNVHDICIETVIAWTKVYPSSIHDIISYHLFFSIVLSKTLESNVHLIPITSATMPSTAFAGGNLSYSQKLFRTASSSSSPGKAKASASRVLSEAANSANPVIGYILTEVSASILDANLKFIREVKAKFDKIRHMNENSANDTEIQSESSKQIMKLRKPKPFIPKSMYQSINVSNLPNIRISVDNSTSSRALIPMLENLTCTDSDLLLLTGEFLNQFSMFLSTKAPDLRMTILQKLKTILKQQPLLQKAPLLLHILKHL